jgi:hypothetical protein
VLLDVDGDVIVVAIESFPGVPFAGLLEASLELLETMRIEPGEYIPSEPSAEPADTAEPEPSSAPEASPTATGSPAEGASA